ncbi:hypothetical protein [Legionella sp.]|uniref:hypothetical protein n=1 Tax=Legionella sp. TaxID=459 RepID=UPI003D10CDFB
MISLEPDVIKAFQAKKESSTLASGELFLGIQKNASALVDYQLGLAVAVTSSAQLNGRSRDLSLTSLLELCRICTETNR